MAFGSSRNTGLTRGAMRYRPNADINVTPLVDVMLVLLIVFMVTAPMLASGLKLSLPQAKSARPFEAKPPFVVTVTRDGRIEVGADEVARGDVGAFLKARTGSDESPAIHLRGDRDTPYGLIVEILDDLARHGLTRIAVRTDPKNRESPAPPVAP